MNDNPIQPTLLAPEKPATKSYAELVEVLKVHLKPKRLIITERFHFHQRVQEEGETVATYMAALRRLADKWRPFDISTEGSVCVHVDCEG